MPTRIKVDVGFAALKRMGLMNQEEELVCTYNMIVEKLLIPNDIQIIQTLPQDNINKILPIVFQTEKEFDGVEKDKDGLVDGILMYKADKKKPEGRRFVELKILKSEPLPEPKIKKGVLKILPSVERELREIANLDLSDVKKIGGK